MIQNWLLVLCLISALTVPTISYAQQKEKGCIAVWKSDNIPVLDLNEKANEFLDAITGGTLRFISSERFDIEQRQSELVDIFVNSSISDSTKRYAGEVLLHVLQITHTEQERIEKVVENEFEALDTKRQAAAILGEQSKRVNLAPAIETKWKSIADDQYQSSYKRQLATRILSY